MYELISVSDNSYYVNCPSKIGVFDNGDGTVYFIDSGNSKDTGRKLRQILDKNSWKLKAILCTHSHADHIGGCKYLQGITGCRIFASGIESCVAQHPVLEPAMLFGGKPCKELQNKFLMAEASVAEDISSPDFPSEITPIPLPGHCLDMKGYRMPDGTVFLADCVSSPETLQKYGIGYIYDVAAYLETLDFVETLNAPIFVPSHTDAVTDMKELCELNRASVLGVAEKILGICKTPKNFETILRELFFSFGLTVSIDQYALIGSTLKSYLTYLHESGKLSFCADDGMILWSANGDAVQ